MEEKKRGAERTQPATRDEFWTDERIRSFLDMLPPEGVPADYHVLLKAYRGMLPDYLPGDTDSRGYGVKLVWRNPDVV